eukprot:TRINITY_DN564_c0_g1_i1.p1 TRINITY_DN564_c0_g1~~TRINITY_DN564_c0_g1_i1.p1  ORF type:complete len:352 (-),score=84.25 TRINITY_DN564_c0_g1_i1:17-1072(-)
MQTLGYAVHNKEDTFHPYEFKRREVGDDDILIKILYAGICHSDIHTAKSEWGPTIYPLVPGHEIVGRVEKVGSHVTKFKVGDNAGVGCFVDSCGSCSECKNNEEMFCEEGSVGTYNSREKDKKTPTYGGYSTQIVIRQHYAIKVSDKFKSLEGVAPLFCAGITTYSPLMAYKDKVVGKRVGVVGLGGLGHMAVKIAVAMGAEVTVFSRSDKKKEDAFKMGAKHFVISENEEEMKKVKGVHSLLINTVSSDHSIPSYLATLGTHGVMVYVGLAPDALKLPLFPLIIGNKSIAGSNIGGIKETQEMLDFCAEKGIVSDIELITADKIDEAYVRTVKSDVRYRFVIDTSSFEKK